MQSEIYCFLEGISCSASIDHLTWESEKIHLIFMFLWKSFQCDYIFLWVLLNILSCSTRSLHLAFQVSIWHDKTIIVLENEWVRWRIYQSIKFHWWKIVGYVVLLFFDVNDLVLLLFHLFFRLAWCLLVIHRTKFFSTLFFSLTIYWFLNFPI